MKKVNFPSLESKNVCLNYKNGGNVNDISSDDEDESPSKSINLLAAQDVISMMNKEIENSFY